MRISVRPKDSGYQNYIQARCRLQRTIVSLNGEPQFGCLTADDEAGVIVRIKRDPDGTLVFDSERGVFVDEVVHGKVEIEFSNEETL